jgi:hypothetical protein
VNKPEVKKKPDQQQQQATTKKIYKQQDKITYSPKWDISILKW